MFALFNIYLNLAIRFTIACRIISKVIQASDGKPLFDGLNHRLATKIVPTLGKTGILNGLIISHIACFDSIKISTLKYLFAGVVALFLLGLKDKIIVFGH